MKANSFRNCIIAVIIIFLFPAIFLYAEDSNHSLGVSLSWDMGLKGTWEYRFSDQLGLRAGIGTYLFMPIFIMDDSFALVQDILLVTHFRPPGKAFQWGLGLGIPVSGIIWYADEDTGSRLVAFMFAPGASFYGGYRFVNGITLQLWLGAGVPIFYEEGIWEFRDISYPLGLWPDLEIELVFPLH